MKPKEHPDHGGLVSLLLLTALAICLGVPFLLMGATGPAWWYNGSFTTNGAPLITGTASDFSAVNQGQAKNIAVTAVNELNTDLAQFGGAGDTLNQLAITLTSTSAQTSDFSALTIGQLKFLAQPFYDRLISLSCTVPPIVSGTYPWAVSQSPKNDFAICNIGQLKELFSFDVTASSAGTGIPDWWVEKYFPGASLSGTGALNPNAYVAWSGSQVTYLTAYQNGWNPLDFYNGQTPTLTIVSGPGQTGSPGGYVPAPLVVSVTGSNQSPIDGAPVTFSVPLGSGKLQASSTSGSTGSVTVLADTSGQAQVFLQLPNVPSGSSQVTVTTGSGAAQVVFSEFADDGTGSYPSPFALSNIIGTFNPDGTETITWQNNYSTGPIYVYQQSGNSWTVATTLPPGTTTYTASSSAAGSLEFGNDYSPGGSTGITGTGATDPGDKPFVSIPVQNYVALDISGTSVTDDVSLIAVDDTGNAVFAYQSISDDYTSEILNVDSWTNGALNNIQTIDPFDSVEYYSVPDPSQPNPPVSITQSISYYPTLLTPSGKVYGSANIGYENEGGGTEGYSTAFSVENNTLNIIGPGGIIHDIFTSDGLESSPYMMDYSGFTPYVASEAGCAGFGDSYILGVSTAARYGFSIQGNDHTYFIGLGETGHVPPVASGATLNISGDRFSPLGMNDYGAIVFSDTAGYGLWQGGTPIPLTFAPSDINNQGDMIGTDLSLEDGVLCSSTEGGIGTPKSFTTLLSSQPFKQWLSNISSIDDNYTYPIISNANSSDDSRTVLFEGTAAQGPNGANPTSQEFLLKFDGNCNPVQMASISLPSGVAILDYAMINPQGVIAALGLPNQPATSVHALLLVPVSLSSTVADTTQTFLNANGAPWGIPPDTNPAYFNEANPPDPTLSKSQEPALVIAYKDVIDALFNVQPFTVTLSFGGFSNVIWKQSNEPANSGTLQNTSSATPQFVNPNTGGLYQFDGTFDSTTVRTSLILPLAGAEIKGVVQADMPKADAFATKVLAKYTPLQVNLLAQQWFWNNYNGDYQGRPDNAGSKTCYRFNPVNDTSGFGAVATWFGVPARVAKASNFLVGYACEKVGIWAFSAWLSQTAGTKNDQSATASYYFGWNVAAGTKSYSADGVATLRGMFSGTDVKTTRLWPNNAAADNSVPPNFPNFEKQFISPGFTRITNP
jgi:hypothetical protein